jgi:hypothetical protein
MAFVFGILAAPVLSRLLPRMKRVSREGISRLNVAGAATAVLCGVFAFPAPNSLRNQVNSVNPHLAIQFIRNQAIRGNMLNDYDFGGYLIWAMPEQKVFIDGRCDIYEWSGLLREYLNWFSLREDPRLLLDKHKIQFVLLRSSSPSRQVMGALTGWKLAYSDNIAAVFVRT